MSPPNDKTTPVDLLGDEFPTLSDPVTREDVGKVHAYVVKRAKQSQAWYFGKKKSKRRWGVGLRIASVLALALAGILPVFSQMTPLWVPPGLASVAIAIAGLGVLLDRLGAFTSGWIRYVNGTEYRRAA